MFLETSRNFGCLLEFWKIYDMTFVGLFKPERWLGCHLDKANGRKLSSQFISSLFKVSLELLLTNIV